MLLNECEKGLKEGVDYGGTYIFAGYPYKENTPTLTLSIFGKFDRQEISSLRDLGLQNIMNDPFTFGEL